MAIIREIKGDVFQALKDRDKRTVFMHGCNMQGKMGSGVAKIVRDKWPHVYKNYSIALNSFSHIELGQVLWDIAEDDPAPLHIANALTQEFYGYDPDETYASVDAIEQSIQEISERSDEWDSEVDFVTVQVGCGLGGLDWWEDIRTLYMESDLDWSVYFLEQDEIKLSEKSEVYPHPNPANVDHLYGKWEATTGGHLRPWAVGMGDTPEEAKRDLITNLKRLAGLRMKEANSLLNANIPDPKTDGGDN